MPGMTEDARPIPEPLARELRALNDLELGAVFADLGVDPLKPPGAKLRAALASIAGDPRPWWEDSLAGHAVDCLAKEPRRGRIAGAGAVDHARATWEGLARLGAAARLLIPDHDREGEAAGVRSVIGAMEAELRAIRDFTGRADPVEGCKLLADEVAARGAKLAVWRDFALSWTGVAADDAAQIGAVRERLHALAAVRAVPGGAHASELAPSSCPAAELPARMGRIWDALARDARANVAEVERLKRDLRAWWGLAEEVPSEPDADAFANVERRLRELDALRVERDAIAEAAGERGTSLASYVRGLREARDERDALARQLAEVRAISHARAVDAAKAEQAAAEARRESADRGRLAAAADLAQREVDAARRSLGCPDDVALSEWAARSAPERAADALIASRDAALAREADAVAELLRWRQWAVKVDPESAEGTNDGLRGRVGWLVVSHRERAATEEAARRGLAAAVEALGDAARDALAEAQTSEIPPGAAERVALLARRYRELRERLGREGLLAALERLAEARDELRRWRAWAGLAGRLPPAALLAARGDDGKLRAAVDAVLRIASGAEDVAAELAKSQRARKSLEGRFAAAFEEGRLAGVAEGPGSARSELRAVAAALRAPPGADLARMVEAIRAAAGPSTLSGPGALAEHVARLRDLAGASAADLAGAVDARDALREIAAITSGG